MTTDREIITEALADEILGAFGITVQDDQQMIAERFMEKVWPLIEQHRPVVAIFASHNEGVVKGVVGAGPLDVLERLNQCDLYECDLSVATFPNPDAAEAWLNDRSAQVLHFDDDDDEDEDEDTDVPEGITVQAVPADFMLNLSRQIAPPAPGLLAEFMDASGRYTGPGSVEGLSAEHYEPTDAELAEAEEIVAQIQRDIASPDFVPMPDEQARPLFERLLRIIHPDDTDEQIAARLDETMAARAAKHAL